MHFKLRLKHRTAVLGIASRELLQLLILEVKHLIEALTEKKPVMRYRKHGAVIVIDELHQTHQILEVKKNIRLVHDKKLRLHQHASYYRKQFVLSAAYSVHRHLCNVRKAGNSKLLVNIRVIIICINRLHLVKTALVPVVYILRSRLISHQRAYSVKLRLQACKRLRKKVISRNIPLLMLNELVDMRYSHAVLPHNISLVGIDVRVKHQPYKSAFARAIAADQNGVVALLYVKADFVKDILGRIDECNFFKSNHVSSLYVISTNNLFIV